MSNESPKKETRRLFLKVPISHWIIIIFCFVLAEIVISIGFKKNDDEWTLRSSQLECVSEKTLLDYARHIERDIYEDSSRRNTFAEVLYLCEAYEIDTPRIQEIINAWKCDSRFSEQDHSIIMCLDTLYSICKNDMELPYDYNQNEYKERAEIFKKLRSEYKNCLNPEYNSVLFIGIYEFFVKIFEQYEFHRFAKYMITKLIQSGKYDNEMLSMNLLSFKILRHSMLANDYGDACDSTALRYLKHLFDWRYEDSAFEKNCTRFPWLQKQKLTLANYIAHHPDSQSIQKYLQEDPLRCASLPDSYITVNLRCFNKHYYFKRCDSYIAVRDSAEFFQWLSLKNVNNLPLVYYSPFWETHDMALDIEDILKNISDTTQIGLFFSFPSMVEIVSDSVTMIVASEEERRIFRYR